MKSVESKLLSMMVNIRQTILVERGVMVLYPSPGRGYSTDNGTRIGRQSHGCEAKPRACMHAPCHLVDDRQEKGKRRAETSSAKTAPGKEEGW